MVIFFRSLDVLIRANVRCGIKARGSFLKPNACRADSIFFCKAIHLSLPWPMPAQITLGLFISGNAPMPDIENSNPLVSANVFFKARDILSIFF